MNNIVVIITNVPNVICASAESHHFEDITRLLTSNILSGLGAQVLHREIEDWKETEAITVVSGWEENLSEPCNLTDEEKEELNAQLREEDAANRAEYEAYLQELLRQERENSEENLSEPCILTDEEKEELNAQLREEDAANRAEYEAYLQKLLRQEREN